ncbi:MAG: hypothetical protein M3Q16_00185 [Pseudomonadota bacterium]|nr:hypothetical protein [Pseudomonadota bacterium]
MKMKSIFTTLSLLGLLTSLSPSAIATVENPDIQAAVRNAITRNDHEAVAKHYEDAARDLQAKVQEQKQLLEHYQDKSYLYGRQAQDLQSHTHALVREYEHAATENIKEAASHRQMALRLEETTRSTSAGPQKLSAAEEAPRNGISSK